MGAPALRRVTTTPQYPVMIVEVLLRELLSSQLRLKTVHMVYSLMYKLVSVTILRILSVQNTALHLIPQPLTLDVSTLNFVINHKIIVLNLKLIIIKLST